MVDEILSLCLHLIGRTPCFRIYGKGRRETHWRKICVYASHRHDRDSRWPLMRGSCVTLTSEVLIIGWDFAHWVIREQVEEPASRQFPVEVKGGRLHNWECRKAAGASFYPSASEVLAHECGHTWQVLRFGSIYLPLVGSVTLFQEGPHPRNRFENEASEQGLFGGLVKGSICAKLLDELRTKEPRT